VNQSILEMTKDLVKSQIEHQHIPPESLQQILQDTYSNLLSLKAQEDRLASSDADYAQGVPKAPVFVNWKGGLKISLPRPARP